jgi:hypothetical protein
LADASNSSQRFRRGGLMNALIVAFRADAK